MRARLNPWIARRCLVAACALLASFGPGCSSPSGPTPMPPPTGNPPVPNPLAPLSVSCPASVTATSSAGGAMPVSFASPVASGGLAPVQVSCTRQSGSLFAIGSTLVQCTATDSSQTSSTCIFTVTINGVIPRLARTKFLAFGDSTTAGEVTVAGSASTSERSPFEALVVIPSASYPTQLATMLRSRYTAQVSAIDVLNGGAPGEWAEEGAARLPGVMANTRPEAVLLVEGINDLNALGSLGVTRAWQALDRMAKEIRLRGARVFIGTLPPSRAGGSRAVPTALITSLNERIRITAAGEGAVLVDLHTALATDIPRFVGSDGLHLTELGYRRVAEIFFDAIRNDLELR